MNDDIADNGDDIANKKSYLSIKGCALLFDNLQIPLDGDKDATDNYDIVQNVVSPIHHFFYSCFLPSLNQKEVCELINPENIIFLDLF